MSRITKTTYLLAMFTKGSTGATIATGKELTEVFSDFTKELSPKTLYLYCFKKPSDLFVYKKIRDWAQEHDVTDEPYSIAKNPYGDPVYFYEL